jgi:hypothetical protein
VAAIGALDSRSGSELPWRGASENEKEKRILVKNIQQKPESGSRI